MNLGIMQPYFFPYLGHYQLIMATDRWVVFDLVRYSRKSWMNRNRILHPTEGWQYVTVPVTGPQDQLLSAVEMVDPDAARRRIQGQLEHYRGKAPHFRVVSDLVNAAFDRVQGRKLRDLNIQSLCVVCEYLDIRFDWCIGSELELDLSSITHAGQWALEISDALGARRYINPPGGRDIFRPQEWSERGIELRFINPPSMGYATGPYQYGENLSILDVLMWNEPEAVRDFLEHNIHLSE